MDFLTNLLGGGLLGAVSSLINGWMKIKDEKDKREFQLKLIKANSEAEVMAAKAQIEVQRTISEGKIAEEEMRAEKEESKGRAQVIAKLTGRYASEDLLEKMISDNTLIGKIFRPAIYLHIIFMDALRGLIRPLSTAGAIGFSFYVLWRAFEIYQHFGIVTEQTIITEVVQPMIGLLVFMVSTMIGFWFTDKSAARRFQAKK